MNDGILYTYSDNFRAQKVLIAAEYSGVKLQVPEDFVFGVTNKSESFLKKFPLGKVPAFEGSDGTLLFESNAIAFYVSNDQLRGDSKDAYTRAQIIQWMNFADSEILPASCTWTFPCMGIMQFNKAATDRAKEDVRQAMSHLDQHLLTRTFLVGQRISLADIVVGCTLLRLYSLVMDYSFRKAYANVNRWFTTFVNQPEVVRVLGKFDLCTNMAVFDAKRFAEFSGKSAPVSSCVKEKKVKKEQTVKELEPEPETEPVVIKQKDPFAGFPHSDFDFDDFKRFYSNNDEALSVPYFWEKFDAKNYSIWHCNYKYNDELAMIFMSCNLMGGMMQRLDKLRKNAFASMCLFGVDKDSTISGIWVWRGHDLVFELSEDWQTDYASYDWKKLDASATETKQLVEKYFKWEGTDEHGRPFNQGKIFK